MDSFPDLEPVCCSMSSSNCCFLTCIQISQEAGRVVWYSYLLKTFPEFVVIHIVKGFVSNRAAGHCRPTPLPETPGHSQASLGQSLWGSLLLCPGSWCAQGFVCALQESISPVLCMFWRLYGGVNGDLLQEDLCHAQGYCTQSPWPCSRPLLTCTSAGDIQTQFCLSPCGVPGSWWARGLLLPIPQKLFFFLIMRILWKNWKLHTKKFDNLDEMENL